MELREMKSLIALSECGSIRAAALQCNLSPAAIHKHLKTLEADFAVQIYKKERGQLALTEAGQMLLPFLRAILLKYQATFTAISEWKDAKCGLVRVGAGPTFSSYQLPALLKRFRRRFPKVDVVVETGNSNQLLARIRSGELDLAFDLALTSIEDDNLEQAALWESQAGFVSALPGLPRTCQLQTLETVPFILFQKGSRMDLIVQEYLDTLNFRPKVVMRSDSAEAIRSMVGAGLGLSVLFLWNLDADLQKSRFTVIQTEAPALFSRIALIRPKNSYTSKPVQDFVDLARSVEWKHLRPVESQGFIGLTDGQR